MRTTPARVLVASIVTRPGSHRDSLDAATRGPGGAHHPAPLIVR
jgi:hypothetical protein